MEVLCGGCGRMLSVADADAGNALRCPSCGRDIHIPSGADSADHDGGLARLAASEDMADEFLTKARLALKKKLLLVCGSCNERLTVEQRLAGKVARCPACGGQIRIPPALTYEEALEPEELMTEAESPKEALDVAEASPAADAESPAVPAAPPHRPPPPAEERPHAARPPPARRGLQIKTVIVSVILAMALAGLGGAISGYFLGRRETPAGLGEDGAGRTEGTRPAVNPPPPPQVGPTPPSPTPAPAIGGPTSSARPSTPAVTQQPRLAVSGVRRTILGGDGSVPAPLNKVFLEVDVSFTAGPVEIRLAAAEATLSTPDGKVAASGVAARGGAFPLAARPGTIIVPPAGSRAESLVFVTPAGLADAVLRIKGVGSVPLPHLPHRPPPAALEIVGEYLEVGRYLKLSFADPIMERLRTGPKQRLTVAAEGEVFRVLLSPADLAGLAAPAGDGTYTATLARGSEKLDCHLRLVQGGKGLILYLADRPYHQIIYERQ